MPFENNEHMKQLYMIMELHTLLCARNLPVRMKSTVNMLTLMKPDKPMTKTSRVSASQNLAWRLARPLTVPHADCGHA